MDWWLFHRINVLQQRTGWAHGVMREYAKYGVVVFAALLLGAGVLSLRRSPRALARTIAGAAAALAALAVNQPIARAVDRARPFASHANVHVLVTKGGDPGFMSDHALVAGAVAAGLCFVSVRLGLVTAAAAALMAFARVYVGAHYPGDVLAGLAFGAVVAIIAVRLADRFLAPLLARLFATPIGRRVATYDPI